MLIFALLCALLVASEATNSAEMLRQEWESYKIHYGKQYSDPNEDYYRLNVYTANREFIAQHNSKHERGEVSYKMKMNKFGDLTHQEFFVLSGLSSTTRHLPVTNVTNGRSFISQGSLSLPDSVDWRSQGAVTAVKNEGNCPASWAFSVTGAIEGQYFKKHKKLVSLSEQNLIDCVGEPNGCAQGWPDTVYNYVINNNGIDTEEAYPYEQRKMACRYTAEYRGATINSFVNIQTANEVQLKEALAVVGPVSVLIDASQPSLPFYSEGVYYDTKCMNQYYNYGALVVGYGVEDGVDYWLLKFSWSESWGDKGYIKIARNRNNHCGVATHATYPEV